MSCEAAHKNASMSLSKKSHLRWHLKLGEGKFRKNVSLFNLSSEDSEDVIFVG